MGCGHSARALQHAPRGSVSQAGATGEGRGSSRREPNRADRGLELHGTVLPQGRHRRVHQAREGHQGGGGSGTTCPVRTPYDRGARPWADGGLPDRRFAQRPQLSTCHGDVGVHRPVAGPYTAFHRRARRGHAGRGRVAAGMVVRPQDAGVHLDGGQGRGPRRHRDGLEGCRLRRR